MSETEQIAKEIGLRIRAYRDAKGWSQEKLARKMEVSFRTVNRAENGKGSSEWTTLSKMAVALGVPLRDLMGISEKPARGKKLRGRDSNSQPTGTQPVPVLVGAYPDSSLLEKLPIQQDAA